LLRFIHVDEGTRPEKGSRQPFPRGAEGKGQGREREQGRQAHVNGAHTQDARPAQRLSYQWEPFRNFAKELPPLFKQHWREIALNQDKVPLDPDWQRYFDYDLAGVLKCLTVRSNGILVGYVFMLVYPHLHYASTLCAVTDMFWLDPAYRRGLAGYRMLATMKKSLQDAGVKVVYANTKLHFEADRGTIGKLFERLGFKPTETLYSIYLG
jgi:hypothetical protein